MFGLYLYPFYVEHISSRAYRYRKNIFNLLEAIRDVLGVDGGMVVVAAVDVVVYVTGSMVDCEVICMVVCVFVIIDVLLGAFVDGVTRSIFVYIPVTVVFVIMNRQLQ